MRQGRDGGDKVGVIKPLTAVGSWSQSCRGTLLLEHRECASKSISSTPWAAARLASVPFTISRNLVKITSIERDAIQPSHPRSLLLLPSIFSRIRVFSNELALCIRWLKYWSFSFSINPSSEYSELISFRVFLEAASCGLNDHISEGVEQ